MGSRPQNLTCSRMRRARRKSTNQKRPKLTGTDDNNYSSISVKLEALKQLLPVNNTTTITCRVKSHNVGCEDGRVYTDLITKIISERYLTQEKLPVNNDDVKGDQLFEETADYIVLLRTQVFVLQKLLDLYDNDSGQSQDNNHSNNV
ncbi:hypothetical protein K7X08_033659 [Anisodus acutangulus]|uniref:Uncharacterized protein n=1 Tax=Anisodus acutangulus TaxID=402998 RepID=A0A9Q1M236_9SOLA|nr:hypothetical protein K7X08_033659 [Anisodus acutangulus]